MAQQPINTKSTQKAVKNSQKRPNWKSIGSTLFSRSRRLGKGVPRPKLHSFEKIVSSTFTILIRVGLSIVVAGLIYLVYKGYNRNQYTIEKFNVPKVYQEGGFDGVVVAHRIMDEVQTIKEKAGSIKEDSLQLSTGEEPEMNVAVMGFGISLNSLTYYAREVLGKGNKSIGGEITELDDQLELTLRMTGRKPETFLSNIGENGRSSALKDLFSQAAEKILGQTDPYRLALLKYRKKDYEGAKEVIRFMILQEREMEWAYVAWGSILEEQKEYKAALDKFRQSAEMNPGFGLAYYRIAQNLSKFQGEAAESTAFYEKAVKLSPGQGDWWNTLGWNYYQNSRYEESDRAFQNGIINRPDLTWIWQNWGSALLQRGDTVQAIEKFREGYKKEPRSLSGIYTLASTYILKRDIDSALFFIKRAEEINPGNIQASYNIASGFHRQKEFDISSQFCKKVIVLAQENNDRNFLQRGYNILAMNKYSVNQFDSAFYFVNLSINVDPEQDFPYTTLAETYAFQGGNEKLFYKAIKKAVDRGFIFKPFLNEEPYKRYKEDPKFLSIINLKKD